MKKQTIYSLFAFGLFGVSAFADTYEGTVIGVTCGHCKKTVSEALSKVEGVKSIGFIDPIKDGERYKIIVNTKDDASVTREMAETALKGSKYRIGKWGEKES